MLEATRLWVTDVTFGLPSNAGVLLWERASGARVGVLTLAVTYAGMLGGAERTLVDFACGLPGGVVLACPEGPSRQRGAGSPTVLALLRATA